MQLAVRCYIHVYVNCEKSSLKSGVWSLEYWYDLVLQYYNTCTPYSVQYWSMIQDTSATTKKGFVSCTLTRQPMRTSAVGAQAFFNSSLLEDYDTLKEAL